jgi:putative membrane protein insertion efficiency factor
MSKIFIGLIKLYQHIFSYQPEVRCKYFPSCSEYMLLAIKKYGAFAGAAKGIFRIVRCNPFSRGGLDLP